MDIGAEVPRLLMQHPRVLAVRLAGSRAAGSAHDFSDWDFVVQADDFDSVASDLPNLVEPLRPIGQQWDPYADHACYMLMLTGAVKVDLIFPDQHRQWSSAWQPSVDTLEAIDHHLWDWIAYIEQKRTGGHPVQVATLLHDMHTLMLKPMGGSSRTTNLDLGGGRVLHGRTPPT
jgi:hypothetical protein